MAFSLYIHIPYCRRICPYCDFNVRAVKQVPEGLYLDGVIAELQLYKEKGWHVEESVETVFLGGGTPSLFSAKGLEKLLQSIDTLWPMASDAECTLEANPGTINLEKLKAYRGSGWNRLSLGVQSFNDANLRFLGRDHTAKEAIEAVELVCKAGFVNMSLDLIFGLQGQTVQDWLEDLGKAIPLQPQHISAYNLTIEEKTIFYKQFQKGKFELPNDETQVEMLLQGRARLEQAGYEAYEISNYAKPSLRSQHNSNYWLGGDYLGIGAGAHSYSKIGLFGKRWWNIRGPEAYLQKVKEGILPVQESESLTEEQALSEFLLTRLRLKEGFAWQDLKKLFDAKHERILRNNAKLLYERDLLNHSEDRLCLTPKGIPLFNEIILQLLSKLDITRSIRLI